MKKIFNFKQQFETLSGFTLVELLVATTIFTIITLGSLSILSASEKTYKRISNNRQAIDNINMVMDSVSREIKFGSDYRCANTLGNFKIVNITNYNSLTNLSFLSGDCNAFSFVPQNRPFERIVYYSDLSMGTINQVLYSRSPEGAYTRVEDLVLTSKNFKVNNFLFKLDGLLNDDFIQPRVEIRVSGIVTTIINSSGQTSTTDLSAQTVATQRILDN